MEILDEILPNYQRSYKSARRALYAGALAAKKDLKERIEKQKFYSLLNHLKRQGLVEKNSNSSGILWKITAAGLDKLKLFEERGGVDYEIARDDKLKIVLFDIPEKEKWKRAWIREALKFLRFKMLQKSVWIGKSRIPERFLEDLRTRHLLGCVHILEVGKAGTVRELV